MADAEESPSSLAELEALAGLGEEPSQAGDELANEADAGDFDLASLAASTGLGARDAAVVGGEDERLNLGAAVVGDSVVPTDPVPSVVAATAVSPVPASIESRPSAARGPWGFVLGVIAGVAAAGVLFLALRDATEPTASSREDEVKAPVAAVAPALPTVVSPPRAPVVVGESAQVPASLSSPDTTGSKVPRAASARPIAPASTAATPSAVDAPATDDPDEDPTRPPTPAPVAEPTAPSRPIDSLLDDALGTGKPAKTKQANADNLMGAELPLTPTAADVTKVIQVLLPAIRGCAMGQSGVANTLLVVRSDGGVASASVTGAPYAGAASGRCMEGVLRRAKFARFRQSVFRVQFPLSIRANTP